MKDNILPGKFRIGKLPSQLEILAEKYEIDHEEVGLDALYAFSHYRVSQGFSEKKSYGLVMKHLEKKYEITYGKNKKC